MNGPLGFISSADCLKGDEFNGNTQSNAVKLGHPFFHQSNNKKCEKSGRTLAAYPNFKIFMKPWYPVACGGS